MIFFPTTDEDFQYFRGLGYTGTINDMHYRALGDMGYTGSLNDRARSYLVSEYGSFHESLKDLRDGTTIFSLTDFRMTVATTGPSEVFTIPCQNVGTFNAVVDWGDGSTSTITTFDDLDLAHTYATAGSYKIRISGTFPNIYFNNSGDKLKVQSVESLGTVGWSVLDGAFRGCSNMTSFISGVADTSSVTTLASMLRDCTSLTSVNVSTLSTPSVTALNNTFRGCTSLTSLDVSNFNTSNVTIMSNMLNGSSALTDVIGVEDFDIEGLDSISRLTNFALGVTLPTARYDALLINWDAQNPFDGITTSFGGSKYTGGGTAAAARANLISTDGWTISDGGTA